MLLKNAAPAYKVKEEGVAKSPYFVCYGMEVVSPFSLRTSKAEVGGEYERCAEWLYLNLSWIILYWKELHPFINLIRISE